MCQRKADANAVSSVSRTTATLPQFQNYVWELLPVRREAMGREFIDDIVIAAVQFWPNEELSKVDAGSPEEQAELRRLAWSVRRVLEFTYGQERFQGYWLLGARFLIPAVLEIVRVWWRRRKDNRAKIAIWRRKWTNE